MLLSGFTFVRDAVRCEYPITQSIASILPIVDEFIVNVGLPDEDGTTDLIASINDPKIKIIHSQWNPHLDHGCYVYTQQANIALFNCRGKWAFYLQADEVVHEEDHPVILGHLAHYGDDERVDGLVLKQINFWGDYQTILSIYPKWERRRCWIIKPHHFVLCAKDASRFTVHKKFKEKGRWLRAVETEARLFHYHGLKSKAGLEEKYATIRQYWEEERMPDKEVDFYAYYPRQFVSEYRGTHPAVMAELIRQHRIHLDLDSPRWRKRLNAKEKKQWRRHKIAQWLPRRWAIKRTYEVVPK